MAEDAIYLDHLATTPVDPRVFEAMRPFFLEEFGNAASRVHGFGRRAREAVEQARRELAALIGAKPQELVFTSGATEAINLAVKGVAEMYGTSRRHLLVGATEHKAVLDTCAFLTTQGFEIETLAVDDQGRIDPAHAAAALREDTLVLAAMWANNEIGTLHPVSELGALCRSRGALFFCDASQAAGKLPVDVDVAHVDLLAISGHKFYGPKGVGALYVRRRDPQVRVAPLVHGGGHERGLRSGTLNVPGIVGLGCAARLALEGLEDEAARLCALRDRLEDRLCTELEDVRRNGPRPGSSEAAAGADARPEGNADIGPAAGSGSGSGPGPGPGAAREPASAAPRLAGCANLSFAGVDAEELLTRLADRIALSSGSACSSASLAPSHVLGALGLPRDRIATSLRFGLGRTTTREDVDRTVELLVETVQAVRQAR